MKVCLDNTFSHFAIKLVFFELISDDDEEDDEGNWDGAVLERMGQNLDKSRNLQTVLKMYEARDRNIVEMNFDRVNVLSGIQLGVMLTVGIVQVILIRSLFEDKKVSGLLKTKT
ncbi:TMED1-like protein [Mya arenaria]|uniref:TMED1-like protein n=1 Tax=Mya arenaria TaxID=6604 RepID=A0ABY7DXB9_MYAAR|nr:TMED1-like protein [Mya arenaria]